MVAREPYQPTDPHLIWGRKEDRVDRRFQARAAIVEELISRWTKPSWCAVDVSGGAGRWLTTLAPHFSRFTHLDLSPDALDEARRSHPEFNNVEYGVIDLLRPAKAGPELAGRTWDTVFCFDTLLYRGDFVETVLNNMRAFMRPGGIAIIDVNVQFRAAISERVKGAHYRGPERKFSPKAAQTLAREAGYRTVATAYQYSELTTPIHRFLAERGLTACVPWPSTWMYMVLQKIEIP